MNTAAPSSPRVVYSGHTANWPILILSAVLSVPLIVIGVANDVSLWSNLAAVVLITFLLVTSLVTSSSLRTTVGSTGASVRFGVFGFPRFHWSLEEIEKAEAVEISPWDQMFGIWWSPMSGLKLSLRSGTAIRLTLTNGRHVTFNVEDSGAAITALEAARRQ